MYLVVAERQGAPWTSLRGTIQNDILKEFIAQKEFIYPAAPVDAAGHRLSSAFCTERGAEVEHDLGQRVSHPRGGRDGRAGARLHAARRHRIRAARASTPGSTSIASRRGSRSSSTRTTTASRRSANYRAARRSVARGDARPLRRARSERSWQLRFHAQTAGVSLTAQQPCEQRGADRGAGARRGARRRAARCTPTRSTRRWRCRPRRRRPARCARSRSWRTRPALADVVDPLGGSYCIERLTGRPRARSAPAVPTSSTPMRRHGGGHRGRLPAAGNRRERLPATSRRWRAGADDRRRQRVRRPPAHEPVQTLLYRRGGRDGAAGRRSEELRSSGTPARVQAALDALKAAAAGQREHHAPAARTRSGRMRDGRGNVRRSQRGLGRIHGSPDNLARPPRTRLRSGSGVLERSR